MSRPRPISLARQVAQRVAAVRRARGWTQDQLAERLGLATRNLQRLESGAQNLTLQTIERLATVLDVPADTLLRAPTSLFPLTTSDGRAPRLVPVLELGAAAGMLADPRSVQAVGWWALEAPESEQLFVAKVRGDSMSPLIPSESHALFRAPVANLARNAVVLFAIRSPAAPEDGGSFVVKRFEAEELLPSGERRITLTSANPAYGPTVLTVSAHDDVRAVAMFVRVLS